MFHNRDIVCISPITWAFHRQRHQIFMTMLADNGNRVYYIENLNPSARRDKQAARKIVRRAGRMISGLFTRTAPDNERIAPICPLVIPGHSRAARYLNRNIFIKNLARHLAARGIRNPVIWTYLATPTVLEFIRLLAPRSIVYDTVFDARIHPDSPADIVESETALIKQADLVLTDNQYLFERCSQFNNRVHIIPPGVDYARYASMTGGSAPRFIHRIPRPRICFFGGVTRHHINIELLAEIAQNKPQWNFFFFGTMVKTNARDLQYPNIHAYPPVSPSLLPAYLDTMDVLILPYRLNEFAHSVYPAKTFECLATGKPVVAAPIPELKRFSGKIIRFADTPAGFVREIEDALANDTPELQRQRKDIAAANTWDTRLSALDQILSGTIQ